MSDQIRLRLVPKTGSGESITLDTYAITPQLAKQLRPDAERASFALRSTLNLGIEAKITRHSSLECMTTMENVENTFNVQLNEVEQTTEITSYTTAETYFSPNKELEIPEALQDTIAFAYIPTPPEFFSLSVIPPNVSVYHLRLMDVMRVLQVGPCHRRGWTGRNIRIAMTDTGFANHPYFISQGYNIVRVSTPTTSHPLLDTSGHGTGESANALIVAPDCQFIGVKHNDYSAEALEMALDQNPHIVTNSWGWNIDVRSKEEIRQLNPNLFNEIRDVENIISDAIDDGVVMIFAGGNGHRAFPASFPEVIAIGGVSVAQNGQLAASSYASSFTSQLYPQRQVPDVCGIVGEASASTPLKGHIMLPVPNNSKLEGENMPNSQSNKGWGVFSGTSAAAPQAAGVAALLLSINPDLTPNQIKSILADTATDVTQGTTSLGDIAQDGHDLATGAGFINAFQACLRAESIN